MLSRSQEVTLEEVPGYLTEIRAQIKLAWPLLLSLVLQYLFEPTSIAFCGHLGQIELASVSMAISIIYIIVISLGRGLTFGANTFLSQTYGSANKKNVGVYLQKGIIFCVLWSMPLIGLLLNTENMLLLLQQDPDVARLAQTFIDVFMPGVLGYFLMFLVMRFLACQNRVIPVLVIYVVSCGANALLNYCLVYVAGLGIRGSALSLMLSYYMVLFLMIFYIWISKTCDDTWGGWSIKCLEEWGEFCVITTSSMGMTMLYWLCSSSGIYICGLLSPLDLSVFAINFQTACAMWMIPGGMMDACSIRIGQFLGANKPKSALNSAKVALVTIVFISIVLGAIIFGCRYLIPLVFTSNKHIIDNGASVLRFTALYIALDGFVNVGVGIVRGTGKQFYGIILCCVNILVALPIGIPLLFKTELRVIGIWLGYNCGTIVQDIVIMIFVGTIKWQKEADKADKRSKVGYTSTESSKPNENTGLLSSTAELYNNSLTKQNSETEKSICHRNLILKRIGTFLCFFMLLSVGIVIRLLVNVNPSYTLFETHLNNATTWTSIQETTVIFKSTDS